MLWLTLRQLKSADEGSRFKAIADLGNFPAEQAVEYLQPVLSDVSLDVRMAVVRTLGKFEDKCVVEPLMLALNDRFASIRQAAAEELGKIGDSVPVRSLIEQLDDSDVGARGAAFSALQKINSPEAKAAVSGREDLEEEARQQILIDEKPLGFVTNEDLQFMQVKVDRNSFFSRVLAATPKSYSVYVLIAINIAMFLVTIAAGSGPIESDLDVLVKLGANYAPLTMHGEWWRIVTCSFLHLNIIHIGLNMWILYRSGPVIEKIFGHLFFVLIYMTSTVFCGLTVIAFGSERMVSAGASGGIFGMYGALLAYLLLFRSEVPDTMFRLIAKNCAIFIGLNLLLGFTITGLTPVRFANAGNIAGVVSGFLLGLVVARPLNLKQRRQQVTLKFGIGAVCSILATLIFYVIVSRISGGR